jgi:hypothetical protein
LFFQRLARELGVPGVAHVGQIPGADFHRRKPFDVFGPMPRQQRRSAIHARMAQPRLGRVYQSPRRQRAMIAREKTHRITNLITFVFPFSLPLLPLSTVLAF